MSANLGGAPPDLYLWSFGDGSVSVERAPVKSFQPGTWSIALAVRNECGVDATSKQVFVDRVAECKLLDRLEPMYFGLEAMEMDASDQLYLDSVIELLDGCSQSCLMISGSGSADEDFVTRSRQRADNVARYFEVRGLDMSRILSVEGMPGSSTCEGPGNSCRYVKMTSTGCR
jgi:PKD repeat protein